jgi:hypothetical protein
VAVLAVKNEPLCKICKSDKRADIDAILELRSLLTRGPNLPNGKKGPFLWNLEKVLKQLGEWGIPNPTEENVKTHWRKHCEVIKGEAVEAAQHAALVKIEELRAGGKHADPDEVLRTIVTLYNEELLERIARGEKSGIPGDLMMKAQQELTKRAHSETQNELLSLFGKGMSAAVKVIQDGPRAVPQIEEPVEDAEYEVIES